MAKKLCRKALEELETATPAHVLANDPAIVARDVLLQTGNQDLSDEAYRRVSNQEQADPNFEQRYTKYASRMKPVL